MIPQLTPVVQIPFATIEAAATVIFASAKRWNRAKSPPSTLQASPPWHIMAGFFPF